MIKLLERSFTISVFDYDSITYFERICDSIIQSCETRQNKGHGFVQSLTDKLVEAPPSDPETLTDVDGNHWTRKGSIHARFAYQKEKTTLKLTMHDLFIPGLTRDEIIGNALFFFLAGFQTTADTIHFLMFELAHHSKLQEEVTP